MDTSENEVALYYALDEFITDCMIFLTMLMLVYNGIVKRGNRRIRRRTIRYNMGERIPGQISHLRRIVDIGIDKLLHDSYDETTSMSRNSVGRNENEKKTASKKRKSFDVDPDIIVEMMNKFTDKADARLEQIAQRIGYAHDASNARKMVFEALENIPGFTLEERVDVAKLLVNNTHELELFFSLHDEARVVLLKKLFR